MGFSAFHYFLFLTTLVIGINCQICPKDKSPLPKEDSCSNYYDCSGGSPVLKTCASGTYWNCMTQSCESKTFTFCCDSSDETIFTVKDGIDYNCKTGAIAPDYHYIDYFFICVNGSKLISAYCNEYGDSYCSAVLDCYKPDIETCSANVSHLVPSTPYDTAAGLFVKDAAWEVCPFDNSNFNDVEDCTSYYNCSSSTAKLYKCPAGYFYDCMNDVCSTNVFAYCCYNDPNSLSQSAQVENYNYRCKNNRVAYDSDYADSFFLCENNRIYIGECNSKDYCNITKTCYNKTTETCELPVTTTTIPTTTTSTTTSSTTTISTTTMMTEGPYTTTTGSGSSTNSTTFNKCFNSTLAVGIYNSCSNFIYYNQTSGAAAIYSCRNNTLFNSFKKCCMTSIEIFTTGCSGDPNKPSINNISCSSIGRNVEDLTDCAKYYTCSDSKTIVSKSCPSGQLFDWKLATCTSTTTAQTVSGCTTSRYNTCVSSNNWKNTACNVITFLPKFLFKNAPSVCKSTLCRIVWFI